MAMITANEMGSSRLTDPLRHLSRHWRFVGAPSDSIGSEELARHCLFVPK
jgi:hypothetical protein